MSRQRPDLNAGAAMTVAAVGLVIWGMLTLLTMPITRDEEYSWGTRAFWIVVNIAIAYLVARGLYATGYDIVDRWRARRERRSS
jgi:hypothetical protein